MQARTVLLTGGNSGIGLECTRVLVREGCRVLIASRDRPASEAVARDLGARHGPGCAEALTLDLSDSTSVRTLARDIERRGLSLNALVCNAGLQFARGPVRNRDGFEATFAVNHLGHFLLTNLLLERLAADAPARIVVVSSAVHDPRRFTGMPHARIDGIDDLAREGGPTRGRFDGRRAYVNSKLCNLWFAYELARRIEAAGLARADRPIAVNAFDPGLVPGSGLARDYPTTLRAAWNHVLPVATAPLRPFFSTISTLARSGAELARLVLDPGRGDAGARYYASHTRWRESVSSRLSYDGARAAELWKASVRLSGLEPRESPFAT